MRPLISNASAKWEVKSQIWDVTFSLPPCLLPPCLPLPLSLSPSVHPPILFCTSPFDCISLMLWQYTLAPFFLGDGCVSACWANGFYTERTALNLSVEYGGLRDWKRERETATEEMKRMDIWEQTDMSAIPCCLNYYLCKHLLPKRWKIMMFWKRGKEQL